MHKYTQDHLKVYIILLRIYDHLSKKKVTDYSTMEVIATKHGGQKLCFEGFMYTKKK